MDKISKIAVNGTTYEILGVETSINGKTGAIAASDIASVLTTAGYKLTDTDTNTVTSINGKTGAIEAQDIASVLIADGYKLTDTDTNTWRSITDSYSGTSSDVSLSQKGGNALYNALVNGYANNAGTVNGHTVNSDVPANAVFTDTNTWQAANSSLVGYVPKSTANKILRADGDGTLYWGDDIDTNSWPTYTSQLTNDSGYITGITKSMVTTALGYTPPSSDTDTVTSINGKTGAISAADIASVLTAAGYALTDTDTNTWRPLGTTEGTACAGNDSRLSDARPASDVYSWAKASSKPSYTKSEIGLGNVDNTADSQKSVNYANSAGYATSAGSAQPVFNNGTWYTVGDDVEIGDHNVGGGLGIKGHNANTRLDFCQYGDASNYKSITFDGSTLYMNGNCDYASSAGYANSAGSAPANGGNSSTVNGHTVNKDVPSNAVFTDTHGSLTASFTPDTTGGTVGTLTISFS